MPAIEGLILMPGAGGTKDHPTLLALEEALSPLPVLRHESASSAFLRISIWRARAHANVRTWIHAYAHVCMRTYVNA